jgi:hypothetical protein
LYVGARNAGFMEEGSRLELLPALVRPISAGTLQWEADVPAGAQLSVQVRTASDPFSLLSEPWVGPDGTPDTAFTQSGQLLHTQHDGHIFFQAAIFRTANLQGQLPLLPYLSLQSGTGRLDQAVDQGQGLYAAASAYAAENVAAVPATFSAEIFSRVFDLSEPIQGGQIFFEGDTPGQTGLLFQVRSAQSAEQLAGQPFAGPDGAPGSFYQSNGQSLWEGHSEDLYIQFRAILASADPKQAPFLRKVVLATHTTRLHHFSLSWSGPDGWTAGQPRTVHVSARFGNNHTMPVWGAVSLSARDPESGLPLPLQPGEASLVNGEATVQVSLPRAVRTEICASLAGVSSCSQPVDIHPASPASIAVSTDLPEPQPHWSPVGQAGQPFGLTLEVYDRFHNLVTDYAGTVRCESWDHSLVDADLLPPVTFTPADGGRRQLSSSLVIQATGEWNLVCSDQDDPSIAGAQSVRIESP